MKTRAITEGSLMAAITVVLALLSYYVPLLTGFSYFLLPLPTTVCYKRWGLVAAVLESVAASVLLVVFIQPMSALILAVDIVIPGLLIGYAYEADKSGAARFVYGYIAFLLALGFELFLAQALTGVSMVEDFLNEVNNSTQQIMNVYQEAGLFEGENGQNLMSSLSNLSDTLKMLFPTVILILPALVSYVALLLDDLFFRRLKLSYSPMPPITQWKIPSTASTFMAVCVLACVIAGRVIKNPVLMVYPYTVEMIIIVIYTVMGFAFFCWLIKFKTGKRMVWLRVLLIILCMFISPLVNVLTIVGIIDVYFDIRRLIDRRERP